MIKRVLSLFILISFIMIIIACASTPQPVTQKEKEEVFKSELVMFYTRCHEESKRKKTSKSDDDFHNIFKTNTVNLFNSKISKTKRSRSLKKMNALCSEELTRWLDRASKIDY
ncbi:MAG TPA: hypothetical protein P5123_06745 [Spirochaetota bacterium]|nr:hypothetical protein [Spirochaetota bacterium]